MTIGAELVVVGASAGAVEALLKLLPLLPAGYKIPIVIVVHVPADKPSMLEELFRVKCALAVREVEDKEPLAAGTVYFAPPGYHVLVESNGFLSLSNEDPVLYSRPSIDVLFESAADAYGNAVLALLLTGANADGAKGLFAIEEAGGTVAVQNPAEASYAAMPAAGLDRCPNALVLSLAEMAALLQKVSP